MVLKGYPSEITLVSLYCLFGNIQSALVTLIFERDPKAWMLSPDNELISVVYSALFGNVVTFSVQAWCIRCKGSIFMAMFNPLSIFVATLYIAALLGFIFLGDDGEEGIGGKGAEGKGGEVCKNVKGIVIRGGMVGKRERDGKWHFH
ncbi:hypothetical protein Goarm_022452 [Gossypium armourianum]|uniref:WAT1-related protein n=1 Tax=Gossypium armourianum TaxID=34283 RepID=A0A7J9KH17_9ROSI|nr:hypothetical protein [Gossypium armourianum]